MDTPPLSAAASSLLGGLLDGAPALVDEVARTRVSVHFQTDSPDLPVLSVCTPDAVRLPNALVTATLPATRQVSVGAGRLSGGGRAWRVTRWWQPPRPRGLSRPRLGLAGLWPSVGEVSGWGVAPPGPAYDGLSPAALLGAGPGLTPAGDDVLAGALVTAHATGDPRLPDWVRRTRAGLTPTATTAVSRAMLHHALDGYATPELARFLTALCRGGDVGAARADLLAVGHSSGAALLVGVLHTLTTYELEGAA
ncbi:MAG TPA: DUF2877 domain-containing protein [Nocardioidaceae bacterium]|nr:DUF2877 domain-containing protein [Nocardioidaceae bacterium]